MAGGSLPQVVEVECFFGVFADPHEDNPEHPRLFVFVCLRQVRDPEDENQVQPFCAETKTLCRGFASRLQLNNLRMPA